MWKKIIAMLSFVVVLCSFSVSNAYFKSEKIMISPHFPMYLNWVNQNCVTIANADQNHPQVTPDLIIDTTSVVAENCTSNGATGKKYSAIVYNTIKGTEQGDYSNPLLCELWFLTKDYGVEKQDYTYWWYFPVNADVYHKPAHPWRFREGDTLCINLYYIMKHFAKQK